MPAGRRPGRRRELHRLRDPGLPADTRVVQLVEDDEIVEITAGGLALHRARDGGTIEREAEEVDWDEDAAEKGGYETFMLKEIHEQADAVAETLADRLLDEGVHLGDIGISDDVPAQRPPRS